MFFILKIFPDWLWPVLLVLAIIAFFAADLVPIKTYQLPIKIVMGILVGVTIFICGAQYADNTWKQAARELEAKVVVAEAQSIEVNKVISERLVTHTQVVKTRGDDIVQYIDREVNKTDTGCIISPEFVSAHNRAAEPLQ